MKKQKKSIGNVIVMVAFCFMVFVVAFGGIGNSKATGGDYEDKAWEFNLSMNDANEKYTTAYAKYTKSAIYFNWQTRNGTLTRIAVQPYAQLNGVKRYAGYYNSSTGASYSRVYEVPSLGQYMVTNYVYEMSPTYLATLGIRSVYGYGEATGQMSPDCAGSYTRLY